MKQYILSILFLLAAIALPGKAQTGDTGTKAVPDAPAMPFLLSSTLTGNNHGTVAISTSKDGGTTYTPLGTDSIVYGASPSDNKNAWKVKMTITPTTGYQVRPDYPKVYKTGNALITAIPPTPMPGTPDVYTFAMPTHPVTVEVAYADNITGVNDITLKEIVTAENVESKLPGKVHFTLSSGRKDSIAVTNWAFNKSGVDSKGTNFDEAYGAVNQFTFDAASLPDSISDTGGKLTGTILVANMAKPLTPNKEEDLVISGGTGDNLNEGTTGNEKPFNGTIGEDNKPTEVKSIEIKEDVKDATLTLKGVTVAGEGEAATTTIKGSKNGTDGASLTLKVEGENKLGILKIESGAAVVLVPQKGATLPDTKIENDGAFADSTALITKVEGTGALDINGTLTGGGTVQQNTPAPPLTATTNDKKGTTFFIWQQKNADGNYTDIVINKYDEEGTPFKSAAAGGITDTYAPATASVGSTNYRCLIKREVTESTITATTLLSTTALTVTVTPKSDPDPGPGPTPPVTYYTVTLPAVEGFTTTPAAGKHTVEEGANFSFSLKVSEGYVGSAPIVTTSRGETLTPRQSDGKYVVRGVDCDIIISLSSTPTANEAIEAESIRIWNTPGGLNIHTPQAVPTAIYTLSGHCIKQFNTPAGDSQIELPEGLYIVVAGNRQQKVIVR